MKKIMTYLLICFLSIAVLSIRVNAKSIFEGQTLTIFNVEDYISTGEDDYADTIGDFEEKYGVKVNYYTYDTNETMYNQFKLNNGLYDLICTSDYMIQKLIKEDLVEKMDDYVIAHFRVAFGNRIVAHMKKFVPVYVGCGGTELEGVDYFIAKKIFRKFEQLNMAMIKDEIDPFIEFLDKTFGKGTMVECIDYLQMLKKMS